MVQPQEQDEPCTFVAVLAFHVEPRPVHYVPVMIGLVHR